MPNLEQARGGLIVIDGSYTYEMIKDRGIQDSVLCRDLDGFFPHVWTVHPFASLLTSPGWTTQFGRPVWHELNERHTFIEGKIGRTARLARCFPCNFLWSQLQLLFDLRRLARQQGISAVRAGDPLYTGLFGWIFGAPDRRAAGGAHTQQQRQNTGGYRPADLSTAVPA